MSNHARVSLLILLVLASLAGCAGQFPLPPVALVPSTPADEARQAGTPSPTALPTIDQDLLTLPAAFRYEVMIRSVGAPDDSLTTLTGQYRDGAWLQTARRSDALAEQLIVARDITTGLLQSYTRVVSDTTWTRWPGVSFDAAYGLASPFTMLRLHTLATDSAMAEADASDPADTLKTQAVFSGTAIRRLLTAGISAVAADADTRGALQSQIATLFAPQTVTYWVGTGDRTVQTTATLLSLGPDNELTPWVEITCRFFDYDDPTIAVAAPSDSTPIADVAGEAAVAEQANIMQGDTTLRVRVFANTGVPATDAIVTVYLAGKQTVVDEKLGPDAQFALPGGQYDLLVHAGGAEQRLRGLVVLEGTLTSNDVLFAFGSLTVTAALGSDTPAVDVVVYPAGESRNFAGYSSENPAHFQLPAGVYDVEVGTQNGKFINRVNGIEVRAGLETAQTIDLSQP